MTGKADFSAEEWELVLEGPPGAGAFSGHRCAVTRQPLWLLDSSRSSVENGP